MYMVELMRYAIAISATWYRTSKALTWAQSRIIRLLISNFSVNLSKNCSRINSMGTIAPIA